MQGNSLPVDVEPVLGLRPERQDGELVRMISRIGPPPEHDLPKPFVT